MYFERHYRVLWMYTILPFPGASTRISTDASFGVLLLRYVI